MQLRNIRPHSQYRPGDLVEVPDGAAYDDFCWEPALLDATQERHPSREVNLITDDERDDEQTEEDRPPAAAPVQFPPAPKEM